MKNTNAKSKILFVHIPKCAGQSIVQLIEDEFLAGEKRGLYVGNPAETVKLMQMTASQLSSYDFLGGHVSLQTFGKLLGPRIEDYFRFTVLRHPVARARSLYNYIISTPNHFQHDAVKKLSLIEFVQTGRLQEGWLYERNFQCKSLKASGKHQEVIAYALENFDCVGTADDISTVVAALRNQFGLQPGNIPRLNTALREESDVKVAEEHPKLLRALEEAVREVDSEDVALYTYFASGGGRPDTGLKVAGGPAMSPESTVTWKEMLNWQRYSEIGGGGLAEIRVFDGATAGVLAAHLQDSEKLILIDPEYAQEHWLGTICEAGGREVASQIWHVPASTRGLKRFSDLGVGDGIRFFHVNVSRSYEEVTRDLQFAADAIVPNGLVVVSGFFDPKSPSTTQAVFDYVGRSDAKLFIVLIGFNKAYLSSSQGLEFYRGLVSNLPATLEASGCACELTAPNTESGRTYMGMFPRSG